MDQPILLFDGVCNLCNRGVQFIIRHDTKEKFKFAALQSEAGQGLLKKFNLPTTDFDTFVLVEGEKYYRRSTAALRIAKDLNGAWKLFYGFIIIPAFLRDWVYNLVANSRYKIFGRTDSCMIPTPELRRRFL
jgi:predicted DCC family thiol-disulfide oxidoreductase YuxK